MKLVTVYGSLLSGMGNWSWLLNNEHSKLLGTDVLEIPCHMVSFGGFPGLIVDESVKNKIYVETYQVTDEIYKRIERLEGFVSQDNPVNFYNKCPIETPYGLSEIYVLNPKDYNLTDTKRGTVPVNNDGVINWKEHRLSKY